VLKNLHHKRVILASKSPRRRQLLEGLGITFEVITHEVDESFPDSLKGAEIAVYLARVKADAFTQEILEGDIVITADTIVWINDHALNKPSDRAEAISMLRELSGNTHKVFTGVCIKSQKNVELFYDETRVQLRVLTEEEIEYYVDHCSPYDKAGSYGAQDWIGLTGIISLSGSYFNVMGLPVHLVYEKLKLF
jgi:septum formation protein